jgi:hypothetical membrane protein
MTALDLAMPRRHTTGKAQAVTLLLACGIAAPLLYFAMLMWIPTLWPGYSSTSQTISELSAIGAPTRSLWFPLGLVYTLLLAAFGWGVWASAQRARALRVAGVMLFAAAVFGLFWPPMHLRDVLAEGGGTLTDTLHIVWTAVNGLLMMIAMGFAAAALAKRFRFYSIASIAALLVTGAITSEDAPRLQANLPTPGMGVWERINVGVMMLWLVVLAVALLRLHREGKIDETDTAH